MIRATVFLPSCCLTAALLASAVMSYGQSQPDYYYGVSLQEARDREARRHWAAETEIQKHLIDAETQFGNDRIACKSDASCSRNAESKFRDKRDQIAIEQNNEAGTNRKNILDINRHFQSPRISGNVGIP